MNSQRFDIAAKMPDGLSKDQIPEMLRTLLAERFKLSIHRESKEQPVYVLVVVKNGSRLKHPTKKQKPSFPTIAAGGPCIHRTAKLTWRKTESGR